MGRLRLRLAAVPTAASNTGGARIYGGWVCQLVTGATIAVLGACPAIAQVTPPAPPCDNIAGTTVTCSGNVSPGIDVNNPYTVLNINNLTADITPASAVDGINFTSAGYITLTSNTGAFHISATGNNAEAIFAQTTSGAILVTSTGDLATAGDNAEAIWARAISTGAVTVNSTGNITTQGSGAEAINAQSVDSQVTVASTGNITASGANSDGIVARNTTTGGVSVTSQGTIAVQRDGINGQAATGNVTITSNGAITTSAANAEAIAAQTATGDVSITSTGNIATVGDNAEAIWARATSSGAVTVNSTGNITTQGSGAEAINAQSVDSQVTVASTGNITASGANSDGIVARNTTTGGVSVTSQGTIAVQRDGINGWAATGNVTITSNGAITTSAANAEAIAAQTATGDVSITSTGNIATVGDNAEAIWARATSTGAVTVNSTGNITTQGSGAEAINAQSVDSQVTVASTGNITASGANSDGIVARNTTTGGVSVTSQGTIAVQRDGINGQAATGNVTITSNGAITTSAANAEAIAAQTATGDVSITSTGNIATVGDNAEAIWARATSSGAISIASTGNITTQGSGADAIEARADGGMVSVISAGDVSVGGLNTNGIRVQSSGAANVTVLSGTVTGGTGNGAGVNFVNGTDNVLTNYGVLSALSGTAVNASSGNETLNNYGTIVGNVTLGTGTNAVFNNAGATFSTGATVNLRTGNTVTNSGTLSPGGAGVLQTTVLTGNLVQTASGTLAVDINPALATSDHVNVSGTANLGGTVSVNMLALPATLTQQFTILSAGAGLTDSGLTVAAGTALGASLSFVNGTDLVLLSTDINFARSNANQNALGEYFNAAFAAGSGGLSPLLLALLNLVDLETYHAALDQLLPEVYSDAQISALYASLGFAQNLLSCKVNGPDTAAIIREGQCLWAGANARFLDSGTTSQQIGFSEAAGLFAAGAQVALAPEWRLGFGAGYQSSVIDTAAGATSDGQLVQGGIALKYNSGPLLLAGVLSGGRGWYDTTRPIAFTGFTANAQSSSEVDILNGGVRLAYVFGSPQLYFKPMVDAAATRLDLGNFTETGGGAANLTVLGDKQTVYTIAPALELGTEWWLANGTLMRPYLRGGASWYEGGDIALSASFVGAPPGIAPFTI